MQRYGAPFAIGFVAGMRSMTPCAALSWAASQGRTRLGWIPNDPAARVIATTAAMAEMAGDKMSFAPDRRIPPSFAVRVALGAVGGWALTGRRASPAAGALFGVAGAIAGTLIGRAARGGDNRTVPGMGRGFGEDLIAASLATAVVGLTERRERSGSASPDRVA